MQPVFFKPIPRPAIWGRTLLRDYFTYDEFPLGIGQSWAFSAQEGGSTVVREGEYAGLSLLDLWQNHPRLFCSKHTRFPVIISLVAPEDDLSIQIHPDSEYARPLGYPSGKNEAWYFIEAERDASIVYGHNARDEVDLRGYIKRGDWEGLIRHRPVSAGDFVYLPAGLLHALKKGSIVYEIQQATDVTYRFYDYRRTDEQGNERELHLEEAIACMRYGSVAENNEPQPVHGIESGLDVTTFIQNESFCVRRYRCNGEGCLCATGYMLVTVVKGSGTAGGKTVRRGDSFLLPAGCKTAIIGGMELMVTCE